MSVTVTKAGFGRLHTIDNAVFEGISYGDFTLRAENQGIYVGPPRSGQSQGESFCVR